jgi:hypothetical protein
MPPYDREIFTSALTQTLEFGSSFGEISADKSIHFVEEIEAMSSGIARGILDRPEQMPARLVDFVVPANRSGTRPAA